MKNFLTGLFVSILSIVIALAIFEVGYRLFAGSGKQSASWNDRPKSYYIHEASKDFRDLPYTETKPANVYRIAVIGDSFTFAPYMQFDDAFPKRLERYLNLNQNQKKVEVINYGVPAYSTSHEVPIVERAIKEGADFILMQITFNDPEIKPYTPTQLYREKNKFGDLVLTHPIFTYWKSLAFVLKRIHNTKTYNNYVQKFFDLFEKPNTWSNFKTSWQKIGNITKQNNTPVAAVVFPLFGIPLNAEYPFHPIHLKVKNLLDELQIPSLDLYKDFEGIPLDRMQVIVGQDFHPNEICHRMATESIMRWIDQTNLPPKSYLPKYGYSERIGIKLPHLKDLDKQGIEPVKDKAPQIDDEGNQIEE
jgi:hypothetical protein